MIRAALMLALLVPLGSAYHAQYIPSGPHFPTGTVLNPCLISAWPMNEGSGVTLNDTSPGGTNAATVNNIANITWGPHSGFPGSSISWSSSGQAFASSTTLTNFSGTTPFSISLWPLPTGGNQTFITTMASTSVQQGWLLWHHLVTGGQNFTDFRITNTVSSNSIDVQGTTNYDSGSGLTYLVATYSGSQTAAGVKLYLNGAVDPPTVITNNLSATAANGLTPSFNAFRDGSIPGGQVMGYFEVYNCVLTPTQISTYYAAGPGIY